MKASNARELPVLQKGDPVIVYDSRRLVKGKVYDITKGQDFVFVRKTILTSTLDSDFSTPRICVYKIPDELRTLETHLEDRIKKSTHV